MQSMYRIGLWLQPEGWDMDWWIGNVVLSDLELDGYRCYMLFEDVGQACSG